MSPASGTISRVNLANRAGILRAALEIVDRLGPDGLTMRRLAAAVNQPAMNLYWRFRSKDELVDKLVDSLFADLPERLTELKERTEEAVDILRSALTSHPKLLPLILTRSELGPNARRTMEELAKILGPDGAKSLLAHTLGVVTIESSAFREALAKMRS
jgi:AcrR family transcriptional regulator